jgi:hypothetical protein
MMGHDDINARLEERVSWQGMIFSFAFAILMLGLGLFVVAFILFSLGVF